MLSLLPAAVTRLGWRCGRRFPSGGALCAGGVVLAFGYPDAVEGPLWRERALPGEAAGAPQSAARVGAAPVAVIRQRAPLAGCCLCCLQLYALGLATAGVPSSCFSWASAEGERG